MENGGDVVGMEQEFRPESGNGDVVGESGQVKKDSRDFDENEIFEEAVEQPMTPLHVPPSDSVGDAVLGGVGIAEVVEGNEANNRELGGESEKFVETIDVQLNDQSAEGQEAAVSETFNESEEVLIGDRSVERHEMVGSDNSAEVEDGEVGVPSSARLAVAADREIHESIDANVAKFVGSANGQNPGEVDIVGAEKFDDCTEALVHKRNPEQHENVIGEAVDGEVSGQGSLELEVVADGKFDESLEAKDDGRPSEKIEASIPCKNFQGGDESRSPLETKNVKDVMSDESNSWEADSAAGKGLGGDPICGSSVVENNGEVIFKERPKEFVFEKSENPEFHAMEDLDMVALDQETEAKEQSHDQDLLRQIKDVSSASFDLSEEQAGNQRSEQDSAINENGIVGDKHSSEQIENESTISLISIGSKKNVKEEGLEMHSFTSGYKVTEGHQNKSVMQQNSDATSSTFGDKKVSSQQAPAATSHPEKLGGPSLPSRPAGLGSSAPLLEPSSRSLLQTRANDPVPQRSSNLSEESLNEDTEENDETREKLQMIRVKFLRLACRLGQTPHNVVVAQVLYRLGLAEQLRRNTNRPGVFSFDRASIVAEQLEAAGQEPLDFSCTIMVIGKTGVGKSSTINSIFDEVKLPTDAFHLGTKKVQETVGTVQGIKVKVIDTPGLFSSSSDQRRNEKILHSVKKFISKSPPDIVLYFDRLDMQSRDYGDVPLLRTITDIFGTSIWFNAIVVLTHAASAPPDGPNGSPLSYEMFVTQRSHVVQQAIRQAAGDVRLMNPVSLVENHSACRMNRAGQRVLPNGQVWKPQLLLLSFASKILAEANMLLKLQDSPPGKPFGSRPRVPPLPYLLSSLLQSRPQLKLPEEQLGDDDNLEENLDETSDSDEGSDYDELPPFKPLTKSQVAKLSKAQKKAYFEELDYRERLFYKKQLKEEKRRRNYMKKMAEMAKDLPNDPNSENIEDENNGPASVPVPMPDFVLPNSFDSDNPSYRYRFLDSSNQWLVRPVLDSQGWDHDVGYEGLNVERLFVMKDTIPISVSGQFTKDKKDCTLQMEVASSIKHSEARTSSLGLDMQTVGKDIAYTLRGDTRFTNFRRNNTAAGISVTLLGDSVSAGLKIEDKLVVNKRFKILISGGTMTGRGDVAYGGRLEATLRDKDYPIGRFLSTLALSVVDWHGDVALGCNAQSQLPLGRGTNVVLHANLSNKGTGQVGVRLNSSEHLQIAILALLPIFKSVMRMLSGSSQSI